MNIEQILISNGFSAKQAKVYVAVLEAGEAPMSVIARKAGLERPTVYGIVGEMQTSGLLSTVSRRGIKYVSALSPRVLIDRFKRSAYLAEQVLPQMLDMAYTSPLKPRLRFFEGKDGLKEVLRDFSHSNEDTMFFSDYASMPADLHAFIWKEIVPERRRRKSFGRGIVPRNAVNEDVKKKDHQRLAEHRLVDFPSPKNPLEFLLYDGTKTAFLSFAPNEIFAIVIDSRAVHATLANIFELVWMTAGKNAEG